MSLKKLFELTISRYIIVGSSVYAFEVGIILLCKYLGASDLVAVGLSFWLGLTLAFVMQKFITFRDERKHKKLVAKQFMAIVALVVWNFVFTLLLTSLLSDKLPLMAVRTLALLTTTSWNFYLYKTYIFARADEELID